MRQVTFHKATFSLPSLSVTLHPFLPSSPPLYLIFFSPFVAIFLAPLFTQSVQLICPTYMSSSSFSATSSFLCLNSHRQSLLFHSQHVSGQSNLVLYITFKLTKPQFQSLQLHIHSHSPDSLSPVILLIQKLNEYDRIHTSLNV